jgi:hypothetical protein
MLFTRFNAGAYRLLFKGIYFTLKGFVFYGYIALEI